MAVSWFPPLRPRHFFSRKCGDVCVRIAIESESSFRIRGFHSTCQPPSQFHLIPFPIPLFTVHVLLPESHMANARTHESSILFSSSSLIIIVTTIHPDIIHALLLKLDRNCSFPFIFTPKWTLLMADGYSNIPCPDWSWKRRRNRNWKNVTNGEF